METREMTEPHRRGGWPALIDEKLGLDLYRKMAEAPPSGMLADVKVAAGETVPVGTVLARIEQP